MGNQMVIMVLCAGVIIVTAILAKTLLSKIKLPAVVGYIVIGIILRGVGDHYGFLDAQMEEVIEFLAEIGVIILLFHIGLDSNLHKLLGQIGKATLVGIGGIAVSAVCGYAAAYYLLDLGFLSSLIIGAAMVATSIGISAGIWEENGAIDSDEGQLLLDVAELDDI